MPDKRTFSRPFAILAGLLLGVLTAGIIFLVILVAMRPAGSDIGLTMTAIHQNNNVSPGQGVETATAAAMIAAQMTPCAWSWASRDEPELTADVENRLNALGMIPHVLTFTVNVRTLGEDCNRGPGTTPTYGIMETRLTLSLTIDAETPVSDLETAYSVLQPPTQTILDLLADYPLSDLPGPTTNLLIDYEVSSTDGPVIYRLATNERTILDVLAAGTLESTAFFERLGGLEAV